MNNNPRRRRAGGVWDRWNAQYRESEARTMAADEYARSQQPTTSSSSDDEITAGSWEELYQKIQKTKKQEQQPTQSVVDSTENKEELEQAKQEIDHSKKQREYSYKTPRPEGYDSQAFYDQFLNPFDILNPFSEEAQSKAERILERTKKDGEPNLYKKDLARENAENLRRMPLDQSNKLNGPSKESKVDRMSRRLFENNLFGTINSDKALTDEEVSEIWNYKMLTDPMFANPVINELNEYVDEAKQQRHEDLVNTKASKDYMLPWYQKATMAISDPQAMFRSSWFKSMFSDFILKSNDSQAKVSAGQISRSNELLDLSDKTHRYMDLMQEYGQCLQTIQAYQDMTGGDFSMLTEGQLKEFDQVLDRQKEIRGIIDAEGLRTAANNLSSWEPKGALGGIGQFVDAVIDDDLGGIRGNLSGLGSNFDRIQKLMDEPNKDFRWGQKLSKYITEANNILSLFDRQTKYKQEDWQKEHLADVKDIEDWKTGNNWMNFKAKVDPYYEAQAELLQEQNFSWRNPAKMALFGWSGIAGSSNSSWWKSLLGMSSKMVGIIGGAATTGGTSAAIQAGAIATSFEADKSAGSDENNIEAADRVGKSLKNQMNAKDWEEFVKEGERHLFNNPRTRGALVASKPEDRENMILDAYLAGIWHSEDPEVQKKHLNAVVGANNHFYANQPVNTSDALIGSVVDIANIQPIKFLAKSSRVYGRVLKSSIKKSVVGDAVEKASLKFQGLSDNIAKNLTRLDNAALAMERNSKVGRALHGAEEAVSNRVKTTLDFARQIPRPYLGLKTATTLKYGTNLAGRFALDTASEMTQEGIQGWTSYMEENGEFDYDVQYNQGHLLRILNDALLAGKAWEYWIGQASPAYRTDADVVGSMNATPLLTLFGPGTLQVAVQGRNYAKEMKMNDAIMQNIYLSKIEDRATTDQGEYYARHLTKDDYDLMMQKFDRLAKVAGRHSEDEEDGIPIDLIERQRNEYKKMYQLGNSNYARGLADEHGLDKNSKTYARFLSLLNYRIEKKNEAQQAERDYQNEVLAPVFGETVIENAGKDESDPSSDAYLLARAFTLMRMIEDWEKIGNLEGTAYSSLNHAKLQLKELQKHLEKRGITANNRNDIESRLSTEQEGVFLREFLTNQVAEGENIEDKTTAEVLDMAEELLRKQEYNKYASYLQDNLYKAFEKKPEEQIEKFENAVIGDRRLEKTLEEDWARSIQAYEDAANREVVDGDTYMGFNGTWYKVKKNEKGQWVKHQYHPKTKVIDEEELEFNPVEYDQYLRNLETAQKQREETKKRTEELKKSKEKPKESAEEEQQPESVQQEQPEELRTQEEPPLVVGTEPEPEPASHEPKETGGRNIGDIVYYQGKRYEVVAKEVANVSDDGLEAFYHYTLREESGTALVMQVEVSEMSDAQAVESGADESDNADDGETPNLEPTQAQQDVIDALRQKKEQDKSRVKNKNGKTITTAYNYFIKIGNKFYQYVRMHGVLDEIGPLFNQSQESRDEYAKTYNRVLKAMEGGKKEYEKTINAIQKEYNEQIESKYGKDSVAANEHRIDLSLYKTQQNLYDDQKNNTAAAIAYIVSRDLPGVPVIAGRIIDEIGRIFFENPTAELENKPEYKMSDETFKKIVKQLKKLNKRFIDLGWVVDTTPYTWYGEFNGVRVAGETDMIAVDRSGHIHVLDFKTTRSHKLYRATIDFDTNNTFVPFFETNASRTVDGEREEGNRSYAEQYAMQLEGYRIMIENQLGTTVETVEVIPFELEYEDNDDDVTEITSVNVLDPINLDPAEHQNIADRIQQVREKFLGEPSHKEEPEEEPEVDQQDIDNQMQQVQSQIDKFQEWHDDARLSNNDVIRDKIKKHVSNLTDLLAKISNLDKKDTTMYQHYVQENERLQREGNDLSVKIEDEIRNADDQYDITPQQYEGGESWINDAPEEVTDEDRNRWFKHNNLHSLSSAIKEMANWAKSIVKGDFIKNSTFEIIRKDIQRPVGISDSEWETLRNETYYFAVRVTYHPAGKKAITFDKDIEIVIGTSDAYENQTNPTMHNVQLRRAVDKKGHYVLNPELLSKLGRNFVKEYFSLLKTLKPGQKIVAKTVKRTNGKLRFGDKDKNLTKTMFYTSGIESLKDLKLSGEDADIYISDANGVRLMTVDGTRTDLELGYSDEEPRLQRKAADRQDTSIPGKQDQEDVPAGTVVYIYKFRNEEDEPGEMRKIPITLKGRKLKEADIKFIWNIITQGKKREQLNKELLDVTEVTNSGSRKKTTIPGFSKWKALQLVTRFGQQSYYQGAEFIFRYKTTQKKDGSFIEDTNFIEITDLRKDAVLGADGKYHRDLVEINLNEEGAYEQLASILSLADMHVSQTGTLSASLNRDDTKSPFGNLYKFFLDEAHENTKKVVLYSGMEISESDVFPEGVNSNETLSGVAWMIKYGHIGTNAEALENPLISIEELTTEGAVNEEPEVRQEEKAAEETPTAGATGEEPAGSAAPEIEISDDILDDVIDDIVPGEEVKNEQQSKEDDEDLLSDDDDFDIDDDTLDEAAQAIAGGNSGASLVVEKLRSKKLTQKEQDRIIKTIRRLVGKVKTQWSDGAVATLASGALVAGRAALDCFKLSRLMPDGTEYHEIFHRVLELLIPANRRKSIYKYYKAKFGEKFKKANGRELTEKDIAEDLAEWYRQFQINRVHVKLHPNILKTFVEIYNYAQDLRNIGDRRFAMLFAIVNSGIFRFAKLRNENIERYEQLFGKEGANFSLTGKVNGNATRINLNSFLAFGGRAEFNDMLECLKYIIIEGYSLDRLASNAASISTSLSDIQQLNKRKGEKEEGHSAWFRVLTGEYIGGEVTIDDAVMYSRLFRESAIIQKANELVAKTYEDVNSKEAKAKRLNIIRKLMSRQTADDITNSQEKWAEVFNKENWPLIETKLNNKLRSISIDSTKRRQDERNERNDTDDGETAYGEDGESTTDPHEHEDESAYDHSRTDDATAAVRFFLSTIPDEHFATEEDVAQGRCEALTRIVKDKEGKEVEEPVLIPNRTNVLGYKQYLSMKQVSNRLLMLCHKVKSAKELNDLLQSLMYTDPIFYRIAKTYNRYYSDQIKHHNSGKNRVAVNGRELSEDRYDQFEDENGVYYKWSDSEKNSESSRGQVIENAMTITNLAKEQFVTQLFNYVACQRADFIQVVFENMLDEDGDVIENEFVGRVKHTDSDYAARVLPKAWFTRFRAGATGIFKRVKNGDKYETDYTDEGKKLLMDAIDTIYYIYKNKTNYKKNGKKYTIKDQEGYRIITADLVNALNVLGFGITSEQLSFWARYVTDADRKGYDTPTAMMYALNRADEQCSFSAFATALQRMFKSVKDNNKLIPVGKLNDVLHLDKKSERFMNKKTGRQEEKPASGTYLFSENAFVKSVAAGVMRFNKVQFDLNTMAPGGKKRYTLAQAHTASDMVDDMNSTQVDAITNTVKKGKIIGDMAKWKYCWSTREGAKGKVKYIGSLIVKHFLANGLSRKDIEAGKRPNDITLETSSGIRMSNDFMGGTAYNKITEREDWLQKAAILEDGGIIFPQLEAKSTWFYLSGIKVPGINHKAIDVMSKDRLPQVGLLTGQKDNVVHMIFNDGVTMDQIDQMIEYAMCEYDQIEKEISRKNTIKSKIKFWNENRFKFAGLTEILYLDQKTGKVETLYLNDGSDKTPEEHLKDAYDKFFGPDVTQQQRRQMMALTLEQGFKKNLELLVRQGLIGVDPNAKDPMFGYYNIGLNTESINELRKLYYVAPSNKDAEKYQELVKQNAREARSKAVLAYVWDIYMRGLISNEETERAFTGAPTFFSWVYGKAKDINGKIVNALIDRFMDQSKRLGGLGSTGERNRPDIPDIRKTYTCAEIKEWKVASHMYEDVKAAFVDNEIRNVYYEIERKHIYDKYGDNIKSEECQNELDALNDRIYGDDKLTIEYIKNELDYEYDPAKKEQRWNELGDPNAPNVVTIGQQELKSKQLALRAAIARGEKYANPFSGDIKVADGAAYITPKMARNLLRMRGAYSDDVRKAFEYLEGWVYEDGKRQNPLKSAEAYKIVMNALIGAQKYSAYGYRKLDQEKNPNTDDVMVHYYDKFALFPIFPQIAPAFSRMVLDKMQKQKIDMLMMDSAVKTGSENAKECNPEKYDSPESFEDFQFDTYEQDYSFIRRQLNTDPNETRRNNMGTQMTKVALANLDRNREYTSPDGKKIRGRDILKNIMKAIDGLSEIGEREIRKEFFKDGKLDIDKFSAFLINELEQRDADENLLDGCEIEIVDRDGNVVEGTEVPEGGRKRLKVPMEAISSVDWVQSIIVSKINKSVIDIGVDGNAYYQRSVWGMEGKATVLSDDDIQWGAFSINQEQPLQMINEKGSMDALISIDYYEDLFKQIKGAQHWGFERRRQWLLDHKIIGRDANADTISSRIPTQAQSSIHALRFVDVLPVVRDTIVLPREFTAITGSDFDIDKDFLSRLSYLVMTIEKNGKKSYEVTTKFDKGTSRYYRNELIGNYLTLLEDHGKAVLDANGKYGGLTIGNSTNISMRSIDDDTSLIRNVLDRLENGQLKERYYAYQFGNLAFQAETKYKFMLGKDGIGPFALNNNSQILTQLYGIKFKKESHSILTWLGCTDLSEAKDKQGNMKLSWLSGLINAHVDVAKDPYIASTNINQFTYNLTNLLIRTGMGERTLLFTMQPVMKELARVYNDASGSFMVDQDKSKTARQESAVLGYIKDEFGGKGKERSNVDYYMMGYDTTDEDKKDVENELGQIAKAIFGINNDGSYSTEFEYSEDGVSFETVSRGCILEDILTNKDVRKNVNKDATMDNMDDGIARYRIRYTDKDGAEKVVDLTARQVQEQVAYINNAFSKYGQQLSDLVNACKIDTKKQGKSYVEQQAYLQKFDDVFNNEDGTLFEQEGLNDLRDNSYVGSKTMRAINLYTEIIGGFSLQATSRFKNIHDKILKRLNSSPQNVDLSKKVQRLIMKALKFRFFYNYAAERSDDDFNYWNSLFYGPDSIQNLLIKIQNKIMRDSKDAFSEYGSGGIITDPLLKALQPDFYEDREDYNNPHMIKLEGALLDDSENANAIERSWDKLFRDETHYVEDSQGNKITFRQFAVNLAVYAFFTSGDTNGQTKFFKFVPNTIRQEIGYIDYMRQLEDKFRDAESEESTGDEAFVDAILNDVFSQNWQDNDIVRAYRTTVGRGKGKKSTFLKMAGVSRIVSFLQRGKNGKWSTVKYPKFLQVLVGAVRKVKDKPFVFIRKTNDEDQYPPYIKIYRPLRDKSDPNRCIVYKFLGTAPVNPEREREGVYPVYKLVLPMTSNFRAGSYDYQILLGPGATQMTYDIKLLQAIEDIFENPEFRYIPKSDIEALDSNMSENDRYKAMVNMFLDRLQASDKDPINIELGEDQIREALSREFAMNEQPLTDKKLKKAVQYVVDILSGKAKKPGDAKKEQKKPEVKKEVKKEDTTVDVDDIDIELDSIQTIDLTKKENKEKYNKLSTVAYRPFEINGVKFASAYQANRYMDIDVLDGSEEEKAQAKQEILALSDEIKGGNSSVSAMKNIMQRFDASKIDREEQRKRSVNNVIASFKANDAARQLLLSTGNAQFIYQNGSTLPEMLTEARDAIREESRDRSEQEKKGREVKKKCNET